MAQLAALGNLFGRVSTSQAYGLASYLRDHASWEAVLPSPVEIACAQAKNEALKGTITVLWSLPLCSVHKPRRLELTKVAKEVSARICACNSTWVSSQMGTGVPQSKRQLVDVPRSQAGLSKAQL